jgi:hypothetical protein
MATPTQPLRHALVDRALDIAVPASPMPGCGCPAWADRGKNHDPGRTWHRVPDLIERRVVLAAVKTAARRRRRWPTASLDRPLRATRFNPQAGTEKRPKSRTKKQPIAKMPAIKERVGWCGEVGFGPAAPGSRGGTGGLRHYGILLA